MPDSTPNRPLWEVMQDAYFKGRGKGFGGERLGYVAELRVLADEIEKRWTPVDYLDEIPKEIIHWLRREADRAEAGES